MVEVVMMGGRHWTNEESKILKEKYFKWGSDIPELNRTKIAIYNKARKMGLSNDGKAHIKMNRRLLEYLNGLLLGDGCIINAKNGTASYRHGDKHREYLVWLRKKLESVGLSCGNIRKNDPVFLLRSHRAEELEKLYHKWYPMGNKKIVNDLTVTPTILKNWYIGDGSYRPRDDDPHHTAGLIITCLFDKKGKKQLVSQMNNKINIKASSTERGVYIWKCSHQRFFNYILSDESQVPPGYGYKIPGEFT